VPVYLGCPEIRAIQQVHSFIHRFENRNQVLIRSTVSTSAEQITFCVTLLVYPSICKLSLTYCPGSPQKSNQMLLVLKPTTSENATKIHA